MVCRTLPVLLVVTLTLLSRGTLSAESPSSPPCGLDSGAVFIDTNTISVDRTSVSAFGRSSGGLRAVSSGTYHLVLQTPTIQITQPLVIAR